MKKILLGLLILGSLSVIAQDECYLDMKFIAEQNLVNARILDDASLGEGTVVLLTEDNCEEGMLEILNNKTGDSYFTYIQNLPFPVVYELRNENPKPTFKMIHALMISTTRDRKTRLGIKTINEDEALTRFTDRSYKHLNLKY